MEFPLETAVKKQPQNEQLRRRMRELMGRIEELEAGCVETSFLTVGIGAKKAFVSTIPIKERNQKGLIRFPVITYEGMMAIVINPSEATGTFVNSFDKQGNKVPSEDSDEEVLSMALRGIKQKPRNSLNDGFDKNDAMLRIGAMTFSPEGSLDESSTILHDQEELEIRIVSHNDLAPWITLQKADFPDWEIVAMKDTAVRTR